MSTIKSSAENLTLNADGANNDVIIQSNGSTKVTVDGANGRVGIGGSPTNKLHIRNDGATQRGDLRLGDAGGTTYWDIGRDNASTGDFTIFNQTDEKLRILSSGGITFNGDTAAANALDDYEEGTWTPAYTPEGGTFGITYVGAIPGRYVKIGKQVTCWFYIGTDGVNTSAASGDNVYLTGLPFAAETVGAGVWGTAVYSEKWSGENPTHAVISSTESRLQLFYRTTVNGSSNNRSKYADMGTGGDSNYVRGFITYGV